MKRFFYRKTAVAARRAQRSKLPMEHSRKDVSEKQLLHTNDSCKIIEFKTRNISHISKAFSDCLRSRSELETSCASNDNKLYAVLEDVLNLYRVSTKSKNNYAFYERLLHDHGIKITRSTKNPLLPSLKAVFGNLNKSSLGRYAAALHMANLEGVRPGDLAQFVKDEGGLVACAREGAAQLNPNKAAKKLKRDTQMMAKLRQSGKPFTSSGLAKELPAGVSLALLSKGADGRFTLLGYQSDGEGAANRFRPLG